MMKRRQRQPSSRRRLPVLPEEMISEILSRVPVRPLLRFRCVCKSWKTLISSPQFVKNYSRISTDQRLACMTHTDWRKITTCSLQSLCESQNNNLIAPSEISSIRVERRYGLILGSCNGLLCLLDGTGFFKIWNPFTRLTSKRSPPLSVMSLEITMSMTMYGFGYDQLHNKYKVLIILEDGITKLHTFGTKTKSWTIIQFLPPCEPPVHLGDRMGKFVTSTGTLNWLVRERDRIISFNLETETYGQVLLPLAHHVDRDLPNNIEVLNNCLCLCYLNDMHCVLWSMNMYGIQESWSKLISIPRCKIPGPIGAFLHIRPLCISENGLVLMEVDSDRFKLQLVMYNALNGKLDYPEIMSPGNNRHYRDYMYIYHESSVSPL